MSRELNTIGSRFVLVFCALAMASAVGCGSGNSFRVASLSAGSATAAANASLKTMSTVATSANSPEVVGLKVKVRGVQLCSGDYGTEGACAENGKLFQLETPREVELTNTSTQEIEFSDVTLNSIPAGTYKHAMVHMAAAYSVRARYHAGGTTHFTTAAGMSSVAGDVADPAGWGYLEFPSLYPTVNAGDYAQETTFFTVPFVHDGGALTVRMAVDVNRAGYFVGTTFHMHYLSLYLLFNEGLPGSVETYRLVQDGNTITDSPHFMTLAFRANGEFIAGRTRGGGDLATGAGSGKTDHPLQNMLTDYSCTSATDCKFTAGATMEAGYVQTITEFARKELDGEGVMKMSAANGSPTNFSIRFRRVAR